MLHFLMLFYHVLIWFLEFSPNVMSYRRGGWSSNPLDGPRVCIWSLSCASIGISLPATNSVSSWSQKNIPWGKHLPDHSALANIYWIWTIQTVYGRRNSAGTNLWCCINVRQKTKSHFFSVYFLPQISSKTLYTDLYRLSSFNFLQFPNLHFDLTLEGSPYSFEGVLYVLQESSIDDSLFLIGIPSSFVLLYKKEVEQPSILAIFLMVWPCSIRNSICALVTSMAGLPCLPGDLWKTKG